MIKKKLSGQTMAIIILGAMLMISIAFGGVYAYYTARTSRVTGEIKLANLDIALGSGDGESDQSAIIIYNKGYIVPGQVLTNTPLVIRNLSTVEIVLIVVYELKAEREVKDINGNVIGVDYIEDEFINPVFGLGCEYLNSKHPDHSIQDPDEIYNYDWYDFVFYGEREDKYYRCMVSRKSIPKYVEDDKGGKNKDNMITVIGENKLSLHKYMGSEYEDSTLSFKFQAYAIGAETGFGITENDTNLEKCNKIVTDIYKSQGYRFLSFS